MRYGREQITRTAVFGGVLVVLAALLAAGPDDRIAKAKARQEGAARAAADVFWRAKINADKEEVAALSGIVRQASATERPAIAAELLRAQASLAADQADAQEHVIPVSGERAVAAARDAETDRALSAKAARERGPTMAMYEKVVRDMSPGEVAGIMGFEGTENRRWTVDGIEWTEVTWSAPSGSPSVTVVFYGTKLMRGKSQSGL